MKTLMTTDNKLVGVAIGNENDKFYVQTTDVGVDTYLSEGIQEGLDSKEHAIAIANIYMVKYDFNFYDWTK
jgi:hypothetical protein